MTEADTIVEDLLRLILRAKDIGMEQTARQIGIASGVAQAESEASRSSSSMLIHGGSSKPNWLM